MLAKPWELPAASFWRRLGVLLLRLGEEVFSGAGVGICSAGRAGILFLLGLSAVDAVGGVFFGGLRVRVCVWMAAGAGLPGLWGLLRWLLSSIIHGVKMVDGHSEVEDAPLQEVCGAGSCSIPRFWSLQLWTWVDLLCFGCHRMEQLLGEDPVFVGWIF